MSAAQRRANMQRILDTYRAHSTIPGAVLAAHFADGLTISVASGLADREHGTPMPADARMLASGAAKTFFAALAVELAGEGRLNLDTPITAYLRGAPWLHRLPNADKVTPRMLMLQTSGYGSFTQAFYDDLGKDPLRPREHLEILKSLFDTPPKYEPGEHFEPSDLNYDLLAVVEEAVAHESPYTEIDRRFVQRLALHATAPVHGPRVVGLVPGYLGVESPVGNVLTTDGTLVVNPAYEWAGGGYVSTAADLARWIAAYCRGEILTPKQWADVAHGVDAPGGQWGGGLWIEHTPLGPSYRAQGMFPGYRTEVRWYRDLDLSVAIQVNISDTEALPVVLDDVARTLSAAPGGGPAASN
ncbi:MAG TPA: serine hydrolase domain-containing protein [Gemmatimonadaceae bacterium]|nr:serine hydrolase domain-containing protein [Gemmatimonadaceae bacterium]